MAKTEAVWTVMVYLAGDNNLTTECNTDDRMTDERMTDERMTDERMTDEAYD